MWVRDAHSAREQNSREKNELSWREVEEESNRNLVHKKKINGTAHERATNLFLYCEKDESVIAMCVINLRNVR